MESALQQILLQFWIHWVTFRPVIVVRPNFWIRKEDSKFCWALKVDGALLLYNLLHPAKRSVSWDRNKNNFWVSFSAILCSITLFYYSAKEEVFLSLLILSKKWRCQLYAKRTIQFIFSLKNNKIITSNVNTILQRRVVRMLWYYRVYEPRFCCCLLSPNDCSHLYFVSVVPWQLNGVLVGPALCLMSPTRAGCRRSP